MKEGMKETRKREKERSGALVLGFEGEKENKRGTERQKD